MADERYLITGAFGCIGAWTVRRLVAEGVPVVTFDLPGRPARLEMIMEPEDLAKVTMVDGDITDQAAFEAAVVDHGITKIIHLAALQVPFVRANPVLGARVNVVGTAIVFETAKRHAEQVGGVVYASSVAVYGTPDMYPAGPLAHDAELYPTTLYGVTKRANEEWARIYWQDYQLPSLGVRPFFVYGPGRDQGVSSTPTKAMVAAAVGRPYHVSFGGTAMYQHADDVAGAMIQASRNLPQGCEVYNLGGSYAHMTDVVAAIEKAAPEMAGKVTFEPQPLFTPDGADGSALEAAIGPISWRSLDDGVRETVELVRHAARHGRIDLDRAIN